MSAAIFMARENGARACSIELGRYRVLVEPRDSEDNAGAVELAERIEAGESGADSLKDRITHLEINNRDLRSYLEREQANLAGLLAGRRRFFGPVLLAPVNAETGWEGEVALLDPVKRWSGRAIPFDSLGEVRRAYPELWIVGTVELGRGLTGILLDGWAEVAS